MDNTKILKQSKKVLITGLVLLAIAIGLIIAMKKVQEKANKAETIDYNTLIFTDEDSEEKRVNVKLADIPYGFAVKESDDSKENYYFLIDENNFLYIARLTDKTYNKLKDMKEKNPEEFSYELEGYIYNTPSELQRLAIEAYNQDSGEEIVTNANFKEYFGKTYLDETKTPYEDTIGLMTMFMIFTAVMAAICGIVYDINAFKTKKTLKKYGKEELEQELLNPSAIAYPKEKIYLTDKYIMSTVSGLIAIEYEDIYWIYIENRKQNGISVGKYLIIRDKTKKRHQLGFTHKNIETLGEIIRKVVEKNPKILVGFTQENQKAFNQLKKEKN